MPPEFRVLYFEIFNLIGDINEDFLHDTFEVVKSLLQILGVRVGPIHQILETLAHLPEFLDDSLLFSVRSEGLRGVAAELAKLLQWGFIGVLPGTPNLTLDEAMLV